MRKLPSRILHLVGVMFFVSIVTFFMVDLLPGSLADALLGDQATAEDLARVEAELGLDKPTYQRYLIWLADALRGDLGRSYITSESIGGAIADRLPVSIELMVLAQVLALAIAVPFGVLAGYREGSLIDKAISSAAFGVLAIPSFVSGILLILIFAIWLRVLPATGFVPLSEGIWPNIRSMILPSLTLALVEAPAYLRLLRSDLTSTLREDFVAVARAKGLSDFRILVSHALRPSSFSLITVMGINIGHLIGGAIVIETLFALPGVGGMLIESIGKRDYLAIQGIVLVVSFAFVFVNLLVDLMYAVLDPRIRHAATR